MPRRDPPPTEEGYFVLHDLRSIDWTAWHAATDRQREIALRDGIEYLVNQHQIEDGDFGVFTVLGHKADLLFVHLRSSSEQLDTAGRSFEQTALAKYTERTSSFISVTEVSGYTTTAFFEDREEEMDPGLARYMRTRLYPSVPDAGFVCFYPMSKRRDPTYNWYDMSLAERAIHMEAHGEIGRKYAGKVTQIISAGIGFDDWEWGVTLFTNDPKSIKQLLYEMRFDPSTSKFAEFGTFYVGHRFDPANLRDVLTGEAIGERDATAAEITDDGPKQLAESIEPFVDLSSVSADDVAVVIYSGGSRETLESAVDDLRMNFDHYDSHILTETFTDDGLDRRIVISIWDNERAADIAAGYLEELEGVESITVGQIGGTDSTTHTPVSGDESISDELTNLEIYGGKPHGEDVYAMVLYSTADLAELKSEVEQLRSGFDRYDTHVLTAIYDSSEDDRRAIVSIWQTKNAAETAGEYLHELPEIVARAGEEAGFGTMGMFYTVKPEYRTDFVDKFQTVGSVITEMDGHVQTELMVNVDDENDMFISSQWTEKEAAMEFFRSDSFRETVQWGRDILAKRPRHVFLT